MERECDGMAEEAEEASKCNGQIGIVLPEGHVSSSSFAAHNVACGLEYMYLGRDGGVDMENSKIFINLN